MIILTRVLLVRPEYLQTAAMQRGCRRRHQTGFRGNGTSPNEQSKEQQDVEAIHSKRDAPELGEQLHSGLPTQGRQPYHDIEASARLSLVSSTTSIAEKRRIIIGATFRRARW